MLSNFSDLAAAGLLQWVETALLAVLLVVYLVAPPMRRILRRAFLGRNDVETTGNVIRAISGLLLVILVVLWVAFGR